MTKSKCFSGARSLRTLGIASLLVVVCGFGLGTALADKDGDTKLNDSAKEVGNNFGQLLKGMGQEVGKVIGSDEKAAKKDEPKEKKNTDDKSTKDKEGHK
ncbi:MAG: hypothetical protein ACYC9K_06585 [Sulfuricaulis sp.]